MEHVFVFFGKSSSKGIFLKVQRFTEFDLESILQENSVHNSFRQPVNTDSFRFKMAQNVYVWANLEKLPSSGKRTCLQKNDRQSWTGHSLYQLSCSQ